MGNVNAKVTDDTIDFIIDSYNQGFCFGMQRDGSFYMWQVNAEHSGRVLLRTHIEQNGDRTVTPVKDVDATDITAEVSDYTKPVHERIEVRGRTVKTSFGANEKELKLVRQRMRRSIGFLATFDGAVFKLFIRSWRLSSARGKARLDGGYTSVRANGIVSRR